MNAGHSLHLPNSGHMGENWGRHATVLGYIPGLWGLGCILNGNLKRFVEIRCDWVPMAQVKSTWDDLRSSRTWPRILLGGKTVLGSPRRFMPRLSHLFL